MAKAKSKAAVGRKAKPSRKSATKTPAVQPVPAEGRVTFSCAGALAEGAGEKISAALAKGNEKEARAINAAERRPCGADLTPIIEAADSDGVERTAKCPKCGNQFTFNKLTVVP